MGANNVDKDLLAMKIHEVFLTKTERITMEELSAVAPNQTSKAIVSAAKNAAVLLGMVLESARLGKDRTRYYHLEPLRVIV